MATYNNPVLRGFHPDPSVVRVGSDFYVVTSSFEYFPGVPIYHSKDLVNWRLIGHALTRKSQVDIRTPEVGGGIWAPTLRWHDGVFYVATACFDRYRPQADDRVWPRGFYVNTTDIWDSSSWSDPVYFDVAGFDQDLFWDDDGTVYLSSTYRKADRTPGLRLKDFAVHVCTVDLKTGRSTSELRLVRESLQGSGVAEGSHIIKHSNFYYLFTAEGGTEGGHSEYVSRSAVGPFGPWELGPCNPLWSNGPDDQVQNAGHADLVEDGKGNWWALLLAVRPRRIDDQWHPSVFGRETFLVPITWKNDWPVMIGEKKVMMQHEAPGVSVTKQLLQWHDDFYNPQLQLGWYRKNTPDTKDYSLLERPGHLRLHGGPYALSSPASPTAFFRKQRHEAITWETKLFFRPASKDTEAGAVVYWNRFTYSSIGICISKSSGHRVVRFQSADGDSIEVRLTDESEGVVLLVESTDDAYRLGFRETGNAGIRWIGLQQKTTMTRDPPVGATFTGMMFGLYAFGRNKPCLQPADFQYAQTF
ncbi:glycosyl hydrolase [Phyllosticta citriasiana]|uniref:Glycosyl hydrolase n=1 Tax=Phyllosticta citriasiana TaxID=595635 RepID=A0ABR1K9C6_9PEZI